MKDKIREFVLRFSKRDELSDSDEIFRENYVNSLFAMQLVMFLEKEYGVAVENDDLDPENFKSVETIEKLLKSKL